MIFQGSRYETVPEINIVDSNGNSHPTVMAGTPPKVLGDYTFYTVKYNDRLDTLAYAFWGDSALWWRIADMNPDYAFFPSQIEPGTHLRIPVVTNA